MQNEFPIALTFDIDWAPDFAIEECIRILMEYSIPATFFATHTSNLIREIQKEKKFEFGIHPNFLPNSTHGKNYHEVMHYILSQFPDADLMRTHGLYQSSSLFLMILQQFKQINADFSIFLPNQYCHPYYFNDEYGHKILRVPYQWEDDFFFLNTSETKTTKNIIYSDAYYQIFDFHPIHVYLNSSTSKQYNLMKNKINAPLNKINKEDAANFINPGIGSKDWLISIINSTDRNRFILCSDIVQQFSRGLHE